MKIAALIAWLVTASGGAVLLARWVAKGRRSRLQRPAAQPVPAGAIFGHLALAVAGLVVWIAYLAAGSATLAWVSFALLLLIAVLGFVMLGRWAGARRALAGAPATPGSGTAARRAALPGPHRRRARGAGGDDRRARAPGGHRRPGMTLGAPRLAEGSPTDPPRTPLPDHEEPRHADHPVRRPHQPGAAGGPGAAHRLRARSAHPMADAAHFAVHARGDDWAEVTEGNAMGWERERYSWTALPDMGAATGTEGGTAPGGTGDGGTAARATVTVSAPSTRTCGVPPGAGATSSSLSATGTDVRVTLTRVPRSWRGRVVGALIPILGARTLGKQLQSVLRHAETR